jgi:hypothetical protein
MSLVDAEVNVAIDAQTARDGYCSLHTANPTTTGGSEATGGSPAYARQPLSFPAASAKASTAGQVTFDVPAGTYGYFGMWSAPTGGTFRGGNPLSTPETYAGQGQLKVTVTVSGTAT